MDNKELSLEEIIAGSSAKNDDPQENSSEEQNGSDAEMSLESIISGSTEKAEKADEEIAERHMLTADEILAGESFTDGFSDEPSADPERHSKLTVDEILNDVNSVEADIEDVESSDKADLSEILGEKEELQDDSDADEYDDEYDEDYDNEPTVIMQKSRQPSSRRMSGRRRAPRKRVHRQVEKPSKFNGTIFGGIILTCIILTVSIVLAITGISVATEYYGIGKSDNDVIFKIPEGSTNEQIADLLYENGIIRNKTLFLIALKIEKPQTIFPGDITLQASMGYADVIEQLSTQRQKLETVNVTITEGMNLLEVANLLEKNKVCKADDFLFEFNKEQGFDFEND